MLDCPANTSNFPSYADILWLYLWIGKQGIISHDGYNPIQESGLYYLQSRYYNPEWGRFINADALISTGQGILGNNMFAYCNNNPVNRIDPTGTASFWYYLIIDSDMGFIHRAVQAHIRMNYSNVRTEVSLSTYGRADILVGGAVWEIKHSGTSPEQRALIARAQASSYILLNKEVTHLGSAGAFAGSFFIGCLDSAYLVECKTPAEGVVLYTVTEVKNYTGEYAFVYVPKEARVDVKKVTTTIAVVGAGALCGLAFVGATDSLQDSKYSFAAIG